jgi:trk system potassium uptake protein
MNIRYILNIEGKTLLIISLFMMTIFPWIYYFNETDLMIPVALSCLLPLFGGVFLMVSTRTSNKIFHLREAHLLVSLTWLLMGLCGSLPFYISGAIPSFVDSVFESISGFTTTGSSILTDIESVPKSLLYWRSLTHWIGGMGIIVLVIAVLPNLNIAGYQLFSAEMSGISSERIKPRVKDIAKRLWYIYFAMTLVVIILLMAGGMDFFESICHSFGTVATGGFSTKNASVGYYSSYIQYIIMIFMLLSGINFALHYFFFTGNFSRVFKDSELKVYLSIVFITGITISLLLYFTQITTYEKAFRDSFFQVISIITATGFATADYLQWYPMAWFLIFLLMFVGACVGSTGGGVKVVRHVVAWKVISRYFSTLIHPNLVRNIQINRNSISDEKAVSIIAFIILYLFVVVISSVIMTMFGLDIPTAIGSVLATLGGIGPGIGKVGPAGNFAAIPEMGKVFLSFIMVIGRLEILTFLVLFTPGFWKK